MKMINLGNFEDTENVIHFYQEGQYGPYLQYKNRNYTIPSFYYDKTNITLKDAMKIIRNRDEWVAKKALVNSSAEVNASCLFIN